MEHTIGEIITLPDGRKAKVVMGIYCDECIFHAPRGCEREKYFSLAFCSKRYRTDNAEIIYKEIKEKKAWKSVN